jgi:hypothetical protein
MVMMIMMMIIMGLECERGDCLERILRRETAKDRVLGSQED